MNEKILYLTTILLFLSTSKAEAYIDPGAGSMVIQTIVAVLLAAGVFWRNILSFLKSLFKREKQDPE